MKILQRVCVLLMTSVVSLGLLGCSEAPQQESTGQYLDNSGLTTKIKASILKNYPALYTKVSVESYKGTVQLSGFVDSKEELNKVVSLVSHTSGVVNVKNDLHVKQ